MNYEQAVRYLLTLGRELASPQHARAAKFDLHNIRVLSAKLGNPHLAFRSVHVAGTNGKGSTSAMLASILSAAGLRCGLYTSPHLIRINERIRIGDMDISDNDFAVTFTRVHDAIEELLATGALAAHPTYFECVTAMAFDYFARQSVEIAVIEVGMGGRLDSTNIIVPEIAVITQIAFDHENFLGHSIEEIAAEKAGIVKESAWVVCAAGHRTAGEIIRRRAAEQHAHLLEVENAFSISNLQAENGCYRFTVGARSQQPDNSSTELCGSQLQPPQDAASSAALAPEHAHPHSELQISLPLAGRFQIQNALTAIAAAGLLAERGFTIGDSAIISGLASVHWPGRLQRINENPAVYLDGTHNPAGAREIVNFWKENWLSVEGERDGGKHRRIHLVYGAMRDKAVDEVAGLLFPLAATVILTQSPQPRSISVKALASLTGHLASSFEIVPEPAAALERALELAAPDDIVFVTGSLYLVGDLLRYWKSRRSASFPAKVRTIS